MEIVTGRYVLEVDDATGALRSLRGNEQPGRELLASKDSDTPLFTIQYLDENRKFHQVSSSQADNCVIHRSDNSDETRLDMELTEVGSLGVDVHVTVRSPHSDPLSYWSLSLAQRPGYVIANIQFPFVVVPYTYEGSGPTNLLVPSGLGKLYRQPKPEQLEPDYPNVWQFTEDQAHFTHYPGTTFAQFLAYYNERQGVYIGCHDTGGRVKIIKPVHHELGIRLGIAHVVGWEGEGQRDLGYEVALGTFAGDWYDAADIYRGWHETARADEPRLHEREDIPSWLLDSPLHVIMRIQGELDHGPAIAHPEFTPYENALPLLDKLSRATDASLVPVIMSWEHPGPWVYPDSFPVAGSDESLQSFTDATRTRGWHVGTYCNGTCWVVGHRWTGYDGDEYYRTNGGESAICRLPDGSPWREGWDSSWRPSYTCCAAVPRTQDVAAEYVEHLLDLGLDWIQFLDQNCGAAAFPCYSTEHSHPSAPGVWMSDALRQLLNRLDKLAENTGRETVFSVESPPNDHFREHFQICDIRPNPVDNSSVPLYKYLFHEYILTQAAFALAPNPYWMQIKTAQSFVEGDLLTAIMGPGGRLMNWTGYPWTPWNTPEGNQEAVLKLLKRSIELRQGAGRDFLVFGRLLRPLAVGNTEHISWECEGKLVSFPSVLHARWQAPDGRVAITLANWTEDARTVRLDRPLAGGYIPRSYRVQGDRLEAIEIDDRESWEFPLPPLSVGLIECEADSSQPAT